MSNPIGDLGRRAFLALASTATAAWAGGLSAWPRPALAAPPGAGLALAFKHRESAIALGRRYLARHPEDALPRALAAELRRAGGTDAAAARAALRIRVQQDFARGDTVLLDGWVLARSECRACAAIALAAAGAN